MSSPVVASGARYAQMPREVVLASGNPGKLKEMAAILAPLEIAVLPQSHFAILEVEETGLTFVENALLKARHAAATSGHPAIADDSGLAVDALQGAPGIYSARYAGKGAGDQANLDKLLMDLRDVPDEQRTARFHCVIVYLRHAGDPTPVVCHAAWEGSILRAPRGRNGFGYDPIFFVPTHACASAELTSAEKNRLSHRGRALRALLQSFGSLPQDEGC